MQYLKAAQMKKISSFFTDFFPQWFEKFPEDDASSNATDIEEGSLSQKAQKQLAKEKQAASTQKIIIEAQAGLLVWHSTLNSHKLTDIWPGFPVRTSYSGTKK